MNKLSTTFNQYKWILLLVVGILFLPTTFVFAQEAIAGFLYQYIVIGFFGWLLGMAAVVLNFAINDFVIGFGVEFDSSGMGDVVDIVWSTIRDLFNLTFIFGLVYIGFKMILRSDDGQTRRWLINLILAALLVNFSLFITKFVVDFSNILAVEIINTGMQDNTFLQRTDDYTRTGTPVDNEVDIAASMINAMNITSIISSDGSVRAAQNQTGATMAFVFGTLLVFLVAMFVFISAGVLLIIRAAVLLVLMIISPFLFLGMVLPMFSGFSRSLWNRLFSRAFMAPIYITVLYITMRLANELGPAAFSTALAPGDGAAGVAEVGSVFGPFILIVVLLMMSLVAAQKLGAEGANTVMRVGNNLRQRGQRAVARGAGGAGARGLAWGAEKTQRGYNRAGNYMASTRAGRYMNDTRTGKAIKSATKAAAAVGTLGIVGGVINDKNIRSTMKAAQNASVAGSETLEQKRQRERGVKRELNDQARKDQQNEDLKKNLAVFEDSAASTADLNEATKELANIMKKMSNEEAGKLKLDTLTNENVALHLTDSAIDAYEKSGNATMEEVQQVRDAKKQAQINMAYTGTAKVDNPEEMNPALRVSKSPAMRTPSTDKEEIRSRLVAKSGNASEMPDEVFQNHEMYEYLSPTVVQNKAANVDNQTRLKMRDALLASYGETPPPPGTPFTIAGSSLAGTPWEKWAERSPEGARFFNG